MERLTILSSGVRHGATRGTVQETDFILVLQGATTIRNNQIFYDLKYKVPPKINETFSK